MERDTYYNDPEIAWRYDEEAGVVGGRGDEGFYLGLALESWKQGHPALELGVGAGGVAIAIARAGIGVVGLERSPAMLEVAREKATGFDNIRLVEGDMADFALPERFGLIYIPARGFLHLLTPEEQRACLRCAWSHLVPGGRLALSYFNPNPAILAETIAGHRNMERLRDMKDSSGYTIKRWSSARIAPATQQIDDTRIEHRVDDQGIVLSTTYRQFRIRYIWRYEMQYLLELAGFEVEALYSGFNNEPFTNWSTEIVWVARKPGAKGRRDHDRRDVSA
jgi:SAM-dependent methyltransferase